MGSGCPMGSGKVDQGLDISWVLEKMLWNLSIQWVLQKACWGLDVSWVLEKVGWVLCVPCGIELLF